LHIKEHHQKRLRLS